MKIRSGFVSNSSSSSFMLASRGPVTKERLLEVFGVPETSFLYFFAVEIAEFFSYTRHMEKITTVDELRAEYSWCDDDEFLEAQADDIQLLNEGWTIYYGASSNEEDGISPWIAEMDIDIKTADLILQKAGGY